MNFRKILVPVVFVDTARHVLQQAAWLARRLHAEVILLHVMTPPVYPAGTLTGGREIPEEELHALVVERAQADLDQIRYPEFAGIAVTRVLLRGDPAEEIVQAARDLNVDLIMMSTHGHGAFYRFLLGSVTAKILHEVACPVWTGVHLEDAPASVFSIRRVLCSVELDSHSRHTAAFAAAMATALYATLTLVHVTAGVEYFGPGGTTVDAVWKDEILGFAAKEIAGLQKSAGTSAGVIVESGDVSQMLNKAVERSNADVLVIGHVPGRSHLGD